MSCKKYPVAMEDVNSFFISGLTHLNHVDDCTYVWMGRRTHDPESIYVGGLVR